MRLEVNDCRPYIQDGVLDVVLESDAALLDEVKKAAEQELISRFGNREEVMGLYADPLDYRLDRDYQRYEEVMLLGVYGDYDPGSTYAAGDLVKDGTSVYVAEEESLGRPLGSSAWRLLGAIGTVYSPKVDLAQAGAALVDTDYYVVGDGREPQALMRLIDVVLYHLHARVNPRSVSLARKERYEQALAWADGIRQGEISYFGKTTETSKRIPWGGNRKQSHGY